MVSPKAMALISVCFLLIAAPSMVLAENSVRVYVPVNGFHGEQQLVAGWPGQVMIEVTNDVELISVTVTLEFDGPGGVALWEELDHKNADYLLPAGALPQRGVNGSSQDGVWPDTLNIAAFAIFSTESLAPGTHTFAALNVVPTQTGTVSLSAGNHETNGQTRFYTVDNEEIPVDWTAEDITVVENLDCNGNGVDDALDISGGTSLDCNSNGLPDECDIVFGTETDCNGNGVPDDCEIVDGTAADCNENLIPDDCDPDADSDGIPDDCEFVVDCNANGVPDAEDILSGFSSDSNGNGYPDECEGLAGNFFRVYVVPEAGHGAQELIHHRAGRIIVGVANDVEIMAALLPIRYRSDDGTPLWPTVSEDDGVFLLPGSSSLFSVTRQGGDWPDSLLMLQTFAGDDGLPIGFHRLCELTVVPSEMGTVSWELAPAAPSFDEASFGLAEDASVITVGLEAPDIVIAPLTDCDGNGIDDAVELADGTASDCNANGVIDECEVADGIAEDCNGNMVPDECEPDDDMDGIPDACEITDDCNYNGIPDVDDIASGYSDDTNLNGLPDECEGLAGNSLRIFVPRTSGHESQHLLVGETSEIMVAAVCDVTLASALLPVEFSSDNGSALWPALDGTTITFLPEGAGSAAHYIKLEALGGAWPDTLMAFAATFPGGSLPVGFHPIIRLTVTPGLYGTVNWSVASVPPSNFSPTFVPGDLEAEFEVPVIAPPIVIGGCCVGRVGNVNQAGGDEPTIGDVTALIDHLFMTQAPLRCVPEADINGSGGAQPTETDVTIGDITALISYLFGGSGALPDCP